MGEGRGTAPAAMLLGIASVIFLEARFAVAEVLDLFRGTIVHQQVLSLDRRTKALHALVMRITRAQNERSPTAEAYGRLVTEGGFHGPWIWAAENLDLVMRHDGVFTIVIGNGSADWFREVDCRVGTWPQLACNDGRIRNIAAPNVEELRVDGIVYRRRLPPMGADRALLPRN